MKLSTTKSVPKSEQDALFDILAPIALALLFDNSPVIKPLLEPFFESYTGPSIGAAAADAAAYGNAVVADATAYVTTDVTAVLTAAYGNTQNLAMVQAGRILDGINAVFQAVFEQYRLEVAAAAAAQKKFRRYLKWFLVAAVLDITNYNYTQ